MTLKVTGLPTALFLDLLDNADMDLFRNVCIPYQCLHYFVVLAGILDNLTERGHSFILPECSRNIHKKSFVVRTYKLIIT